MFDTIVFLIAISLSIGISVLISQPFNGAIVRLRANYLPKAVSLDNVLEDGAGSTSGPRALSSFLLSERRSTAKIGPVVTGVFAMMLRTKRLEGWQGIYKGSIPVAIQIFVLSTLTVMFFSGASASSPGSAYKAGPAVQDSSASLPTCSTCSSYPSLRSRSTSSPTAPSFTHASCRSTIHARTCASCSRTPSSASLGVCTSSRACSPPTCCTSCGSVSPLASFVSSPCLLSAVSAALHLLVRATTRIRPQLEHARDQPCGSAHLYPVERRQRDRAGSTRVRYGATVDATTREAEPSPPSLRPCAYQRQRCSFALLASGYRSCTGSARRRVPGLRSLQEVDRWRLGQASPFLPR